MPAFDLPAPRSGPPGRLSARHPALPEPATHLQTRALATRRAPGEVPKKFLRVLDLQTGKIVWEHGQDGRAGSWGGALSTAGNLVFYGDGSGDFAAVGARAGRPLLHWPANANWKASPMTYLANGKQHVAIAGGPNILAFARRKGRANWRL
jgi:hypothetical protein